MPDQPKTPLQVGQSGFNFHRKLSLYQRMNFYWAGPLEGHFKNFNFRDVCVEGGHGCQSEAYFNSMHIIIINDDILGTFGALHV